MTIHPRACLSVLCIAAFLVAASLNASGANPARPNVIVIMADDIGAEGLACYGSTIYTTPNLDSMAAVAGIELNHKVDGMDLSHNLLGGKGQDRDHILMSFKKEFFVRDKRFRLDQDGTLYDTPATSDKERYSEKETLATEHHAHRERLQSILNKFMAIDQEFFGAAESKKKKQSDAL